MSWVTNTSLQWGSFVLVLAGITAVRSEIWRDGRYKKERFPVSLDKQQEIFRASNLTPNNIEYVGCGYDMYNGSDIDENAGFSLNNYRGPVIDTYNISQKTLEEQPDELGVWVSNEFQCDISNELTSVDSRQKLNSIVKSQTKKEDPGLFSSSVMESKKTDFILNTLKRFREVIVKKYRCTVYSAGILTNSSRSTMKRFHSIVRRLTDGCKGDWKEDSCPFDKYIVNMDFEGCENCIGPWMRFFADFGTHITSRVVMGGVIRKFTNYSKKTASRIATALDDTVVHSSSWFGLSRGRSDNTSRSEFNDSRHGKEDDILQYTVGPEPSDASLPPEVFEDWVRNVAHNPVPIDTEFIPLYEMMPDDDSREIYKEALRYYAKVKGVDYVEGNLTSRGLRSSILHLLKESTVVTLNGADRVNNDVCPGKSRIMFGFGVNLNRRRQILEIKTCYSGMNACILDQNKDVKSSFVVSYCNEAKEYDFTQKIIKGSLKSGAYSEVVCPENTVIGLGVIIQFQYHMMITSCPKGNRRCGFKDLGINGLIWVVCFPKATFGVNTFEIRANAVSPKRGLPCRIGHRVINGFSITNNYSGQMVRAEVCGKFETSCRSSTQNRMPVATYIHVYLMSIEGDVAKDAVMLDLRNKVEQTNDATIQ